MTPAEYVTVFLLRLIAAACWTSQATIFAICLNVHALDIELSA